jgi:hypothetical protein
MIVRKRAPERPAAPRRPPYSADDLGMGVAAATSMLNAQSMGSCSVVTSQAGESPE